MIKCPYCESAVSEFANTCPNCGKAISKEIVEKGLEKQKENNIKKEQKRILQKLGKEKYIPLIVAMIYMLLGFVNSTQQKNNGNNVFIIYTSIWCFIISISFLTKIYQSFRGYIFKNIQMVVDIYYTLMIVSVTLSNIRNMKVMYVMQNLMFSLVFIISLILCIRMGKNRADT